MSKRFVLVYVLKKLNRSMGFGIENSSVFYPNTVTLWKSDVFNNILNFIIEIEREISEWDE